VLRGKYLLSLRGFYEGYSEIDVKLPGGRNPYDFIRYDFLRSPNANMDERTYIKAHALGEEAFKEILAHSEERYKAQLALCEEFWKKDKSYHGVKPIGCPFYTYVAKKYLGEAANENDVLVKAIDTLRFFPLNTKWNKNTIAEYEKELGFSNDPTPCSPEPAEGRPIPVDRRIKDWSGWVQNPYTSLGSSEADSVMEYNGHDYLLGYWTGRYYGFVGEND
jgi:hypothetical protein